MNTSQDQAQKNFEPSEDESEVVADGGEDGVGGIAGGSLEIAAAKMALSLCTTIVRKITVKLLHRYAPSIGLWTD